jgi:dystroglycan 1
MPAAYIIMWKKQDGEFPLARATDCDGLLNITNVQLSDAGTYVCMGSNSRAIDEETAQLIVEEG